MPRQSLEKNRGSHSTTQPVNSRVGHSGRAFELVLPLLLLVRATNFFWISATATLPDER